jgi:F-type H+-transporting ATPase subunit delta
MPAPQQSSAVARNYAEVLFTLAGRADSAEAWGRALSAIAEAIRQDATMRRFLESPRIDAARKQAVLVRAFGSVLPAPFVRFLATIVRKRRQSAIPAIAVEYERLLDVAANRVHAEVTVARAMDDAAVQAMAAQLSKAFGKEVVPHLTVDPAILGGAVVRIGDRVVDGSVRRRLGALRTRLLAGA